MKTVLLKTIATGALALFLSFSLWADDKSPVKFGKVDMRELAEEAHPVDSSASAAYLYKSAKAYFDITNDGKINLVIDYHEKIKIYDEDAEDYANYEIYIYKDGSTRERMSNLKAVTYNLESGKMVKTKLSKKDVFKEKVSDNRDVHKFAMPEVKAGSVLEVKYSLTTPFYYSLPKFYFQEYVPVNEVSYEIRIPDYYTYTPIPTGTIPLNRTQKTVNGDYRNDEAYTFTASNVPAMEKDD